MRITTFEKTVLACLCSAILAVVLSYIEAATLGVAGDGHLWNVAFGIVTVGIVHAVFSYWYGDLWWFFPTESVDQ